jgi:DNA-binding transcriptional regulator YhcF (GntR family)
MRAYDFLQSNEIIYNKRGIGYFVAEDAKEKFSITDENNFWKKNFQPFFKNIQLLNIDVRKLKKDTMSLFKKIKNYEKNKRNENKQ